MKEQRAYLIVRLAAKTKNEQSVNDTSPFLKKSMSSLEKKRLDRRLKWNPSHPTAMNDWKRKVIFIEEHYPNLEIRNVKKVSANAGTISKFSYPIQRPFASYKFSRQKFQKYISDKVDSILNAAHWQNKFSRQEILPSS